VTARHDDGPIDFDRPAPSMHKSQFEYLAETIGRVIDTTAFEAVSVEGGNVTWSVPVGELCEAVATALARTTPLFDRERFLMRTRGLR
jgi:hypothetical protein